MSTHQRKRINEMLTNLLKDLGEIGVAIGGDGDVKVFFFLEICCSYVQLSNMKKLSPFESCCLLT
jgi:hypothetical protein